MLQKMSEFTRKMWSQMCRNHAYFSSRYGANLRNFWRMFIITLLKIHFIALCTDCMCCLKLSFLADAYSQWPQLNQRTLCTACMCCFRVSFLDWSQLNWYPLCTKIGCCNFWLAAATFGWLEPLLASCSHFWLAAVTFGWLQPLLAGCSHFWLAAATFGCLEPLLASCSHFWLTSANFG